MAKLLSDDYPSRSNGRDAFPPEFFDGKWRLLAAGEDFPENANVESAARKFRKEAQNKGLKGQAIVIDRESFRARAR